MPIFENPGPFRGFLKKHFSMYERDPIISRNLKNVENIDLLAKYFHTENWLKLVKLKSTIELSFLINIENVESCSLSEGLWKFPELSLNEILKMVCFLEKNRIIRKKWLQIWYILVRVTHC